jgi:tetratricopeptide (TPR) repeat protein
LRKYDEALDDFFNAVRYSTTENNIDGLNLSIAKTLYFLKRHHAALKYINEEIGQEPNQWGSYVIRGAIFRELGKKEEAVQNFNKAVTLAPYERTIYYERAYLFSQYRMFAEVINDLKTILTIRPGDQPAQSMLWKVQNMLKGSDHTERER